MDHLEQKRKEEQKAKEEATLNVDKNESEKGFVWEQIHVVLKLMMKVFQKVMLS